MAEAPSLLSLCIQSVKLRLVEGDDPIPDIYELPEDLLDVLVPQFPALALHNFQINMPFKSWDDCEFADDALTSGRKRGRNRKFEAAWKAFFELRWPRLVDSVNLGDWQELYWGAHLQDCIDGAVELALLPAFSGRLGSIKISDKILRCIGHEKHKNDQNCDCTKLSYHFRKFGSYARCLRLMNVLCVTETCELLRTSKLENLVLLWIRSKEYVEPLCKLLVQNHETLTSLELTHCRLSVSIINAICACLHQKDIQTKGIQHFSIKTCVVEMDLVATPSAFISFLRSGRSLYSLNFCDDHLNRRFARMVFSTLLDSNSNLSSLDLSENNIAGWLSTFDWRSAGKSLQSLRVLKLRKNNLRRDDAENLRHALVRMPNLATLDLSDNPIGDSGVRSLISYLLEESKRISALANLNLEYCGLSCDGATELLDTLSSLGKPLKSLSIADNTIRTDNSNDRLKVANAIANFLQSPIQSLDVSGIGLGPDGLFELFLKLEKELKVVNINISKNRGGREAAIFLAKLITVAPKLVSVNASHNLMPDDSLAFIFCLVKDAKGIPDSLECIDLRGNSCQTTADVRYFHEFQHIFILPSSPAQSVPYDDDP